MTQETFSRRIAIVGSLAMGCEAILAARAGAGEGLIEPRMRLARRAASQFDVALTLDACPGGFDQRLAAALVEAAIPATIFISGAWIRRNPQGLAFLLAHPRIFGIENHGEWHLPPVLGHRRLFGLAVAGDLASVKVEVERGAETIARVTGRTPRWYRAAAGFYSPEALELIRGLGVLIAGYSLNGDEGASLPAAAVAKRISAGRNGDVVVSHINQPRRSSGAGVIEGALALKRRGARFVRLDELGPSDFVYG